MSDIASLNVSQRVFASQQAHASLIHQINISPGGIPELPVTEAHVTTEGSLGMVGLILDFTAA